MEVLSQVQSLVVEHAFTIGMGLLVALVLAGVAWYSMSRMSSGSKSEALVNQARVNEAAMNPNEMPGNMESNRQEEAEQQSDMMKQVQGDMQSQDE
jgi:hypothetical protein